MSLFVNALICFAMILGFNLFLTPLSIWLWMCGVTFLIAKIQDTFLSALGAAATAGVLSLLIGGGLAWVFHNALGVQLATIYFIGVVHTLVSFAYDGN